MTPSYLEPTESRFAESKPPTEFARKQASRPSFRQSEISIPLVQPILSNAMAIVHRRLNLMTKDGDTRSGLQPPGANDPPRQTQTTRSRRSFSGLTIANHLPTPEVDHELTVGHPSHSIRSYDALAGMIPRSRPRQSSTRRTTDRGCTSYVGCPTRGALSQGQMSSGASSAVSIQRCHPARRIPAATRRSAAPNRH